MNRKLMTSVSFASVFCFGYFSAERFCRAKKENTDAKSSRSAAVLGYADTRPKDCFRCGNNFRFFKISRRF